IGPGRAFYV
nr:Chain E, Peptide (PV9) of HIV gp120 MN isolate (IGPGRAFYV) [HIV-1 M:B_MN]5KD7_H Chain H, Peptide (PV9) of HIV gp120 MN isolate (IGPGRAFYV) [HIV-1 M:B_MN]5KD7_K Chain K, Peptide (PV9) of HIV gp120 MN isolate (IGPGRAFYV) [HIV-1 M:B_MN]5KD7_P Chain P, Peptide (PV9) of HIV gp120 MN isolate (IGPGRAFYV) [HIV-1 M:B_MN]